MRSGKIILTIDALVNLILGILLIPASTDIADLIGVPSVAAGFYPSILGAILLGIGIALLIEVGHTHQRTRGLGFYGAITINLCGGLVLAGWLLFANLQLPLHGFVFLWILVFLLVILSSVEWFVEVRQKYK